MLRTHEEEASVKNVSASYLVYVDVEHDSRDDVVKRLQLLAEQEAKFIAEIK